MTLGEAVYMYVTPHNQHVIARYVNLESSCRLREIPHNSDVESRPDSRQVYRDIMGEIKSGSRACKYRARLCRRPCVIVYVTVRWDEE